MGYVAQARDLAGKALATAESYVAAGQKKVEETGAAKSAEDVKNDAAGLASAADKKVDGAISVRCFGTLSPPLRLVLTL